MMQNLHLKFLACQWKVDGILDVQWYPIRIISFKTSEPGIYGLFQKTYLNIPFRTWELRPKAENSCYLTVTGAMVEAEFVFKVNNSAIVAHAPFTE